MAFGLVLASTFFPYLDANSAAKCSAKITSKSLPPNLVSKVVPNTYLNVFFISKCLVYVYTQIYT